MKHTNLAFLLVCGLRFVESCSIPTNSRQPQTVQERAEKAQTIVYAQARKIFPKPSSSSSLTIKLYTAAFRLLCPIKNEQFVNNLEEHALKNNLQFNVSDLGRATGRCINNEVEIGKHYFLFLFENDDEGNLVHQYQLDQVNEQPAVLLDTVKNRKYLEDFTLECQQVLQSIEPVEKIPEESFDSMKIEKATTTHIQESTSVINQLPEKQLSGKEFSGHTQKPQLLYGAEEITSTRLSYLSRKLQTTHNDAYYSCSVTEVLLHTYENGLLFVFLLNLTKPVLVCC